MSETSSSSSSSSTPSSGPSWLGLLKWSLAHHDGTTDRELEPMEEEEKEWLKNALKDLVRDDASRMKEILTKFKTILAQKYLSQEDGECLYAELDELREIIEQYDMSLNFVKAGGVDLLFDLACLDLSSEDFSYNKREIELKSKEIQKNNENLNNSEQILDEQTENYSNFYLNFVKLSKNQINYEDFSLISIEIFSLLGSICQNNLQIQNELNQKNYKQKIFSNYFHNNYIKKNLKILFKYNFFFHSYLRNNKIEENQFFLLNYYQYFLINLLKNNLNSFFFNTKMFSLLNYMIISDYCQSFTISIMLNSFSESLIKFLYDFMFHYDNLKLYNSVDQNLNMKNLLLEPFSTYFEMFENDFYAESDANPSTSVRITNPKLLSCLLSIPQQESHSDYEQHELTVSILQLLNSIASTTLGFELLNKYNFLTPLNDKLKNLNSEINGMKPQNEDEEDILEYKKEELKLTLSLSISLKKMNVKYPSPQAIMNEKMTRKALESESSSQNRELDGNNTEEPVLLLANPKPEAASNIP